MEFDTLQLKAVEGLLRSINGLRLTLLVCECNSSSDLAAKSNKYI